MGQSTGGTQARVFDAIGVLVATAAVFTELTLAPDMMRSPYDAIAFCVLLLAAQSLWFRRRAPVLVAWIVAAPTVAAAIIFSVRQTVFRDDMDPDRGFLTIAILFAVYSLMVYADNRRRAWPVIFVAFVASLFAPNLLAAVGSSIALIGAPAALGMYASARRKLLEALRERALRAEREQELIAAQVRTEERVRMAAEVHDLVAHDVSLMVLQAGTLRLGTTDARTRDAAEDLRLTGRRALEGLRELVDALEDPERTSSSETEQVPLPDFSDLLRDSASVGIPVSVISHGAGGVVSPAVGRTLYRIVQESLTNVRKHSPGSTVTLTSRTEDDAVHILVRNSRGSATSELPAGSGSGLLGLRRRIELLDGTFRAEPCVDGGFEVEAVLPTHGKVIT